MRTAVGMALGAVAALVLLSGAAAWTAAAVATRLAPCPRATFLAAAVLALVLSLVPPATATTGAATWWLDAMHLAVFTAVVAALAPTVPSRSGTRRVRLEAQAHGGVA